MLRISIMHNNDTKKFLKIEKKYFINIQTEYYFFVLRDHSTLHAQK